MQNFYYDFSIKKTLNILCLNNYLVTLMDTFESTSKNNSFTKSFSLLTNVKAENENIDNKR